MLLHRRQDAKSALQALGIVVLDVVFNRLNQRFSVRKFSAVVAFSLEDAPESFHRTVVNALADSRHTLDHSGSRQLRMEDITCVLKAAVAVEDWVSAWVCRNCQIKGIKYEGIVVPVSNHIGNNAPVTKIQNRTQIQLALFFSAIPLELRYVGQPLLVRPSCIEVPCKDIFSEILRTLCAAGAAVVGVLHRRTNVLRAADPQHSLVIDSGVVVSFQIVPNAPVSLVRPFFMNLLHQLANPLVFNLAGAGLLS